MLPYTKETALWPVWAAIMGHVVLLFAMAVLGVVRGEGFLAAIVSVALTAGVAGWEIRVRGRPGGLGVSLLLTWLVAGILVAIALRTGFL